MSEPLAFLNGRVVPQSQAHLGFHDAGFVFGATVTDLCRTFRHRLFRFPEHLKRFRESCRAAYLDIAESDEAIARQASELVEHNVRFLRAEADLALVMFATPGPVGYYLGQPTVPGDQPTFAMHTFPLPFRRYRPWMTEGIALATPRIPQVPPACVDPRIKHRSRMHWWLADQEVRRASPGAQALLLDPEGNVTETASANFLLGKNGTLVSPPLDRVLNGVTLGVIAELAGRLGIPLEHRPISLEECRTADEAILTCTTFCVAGVRSINGHPLPFPGSLFQRLLEAWTQESGVDVSRQILTVD